MKKIFLSNRGFSLIELSVSAAIGAISLLLLSQVHLKTVEQNRDSRILLTMQILSSSLTTLAMSPHFLKTETSNKNWAENMIFSDCLGKSCSKDFKTSGGERKYYGLKIFDKSGFQYSGTWLKPKYFTDNGSPCSGLSKKCPIEVSSRVQIGCIDGGFRCSGTDINEVFVNHRVSAPIQYSHLKENESVIDKKLIIPNLFARSAATSERVYRTFVTQNIMRNITSDDPQSGGGDSSSSGNNSSSGDGGSCGGSCNDPNYPNCPRRRGGSVGGKSSGLGSVIVSPGRGGRGGRGGPGRGGRGRGGGSVGGKSSGLGSGGPPGRGGRGRGGGSGGGSGGRGPGGMF